VARWGGEEFFVALPGADAAAGVAFADELLLVRAERDRCRGQTKRGARPDQV
jgi:PleD family two-component response regulator